MSKLRIVKLLDPIRMTISGTFTPRGAYAAGTDYAVGDQVDYQGSSYVMYNDGPSGTLPTDSSYWGVLAEKGDDGAAGAAGPSGAAGADGLIQSVVAGANVAVDSTDPANPVVSSTDTNSTPAGSGSELQYRVDGTTFGALAGSSASGSDLTLGGTLTMPSTLSSTVPLITFSGDTNTGLGRGAGDTLNLITAGTSRLTIDSSNATFTPTINANNGLLSAASVRLAVHLRVGSTSAPTNTTAGDATVVRLNVGNGFTQTARVHIAAGTASAGTAPLKLISGTSLTAPEDGAIEYDGSHFYGTIGTTRTILDNVGGSVVEITGTSQAAAVNVKYIANNAGLVTVTLPSSASQGDQVLLRGKGAGGWKLAQNASQTIHGSSDTTTGTGGSLASQTRYDCVTVECITANTDWIILNQRGTLTIV